MTVGPPISSAIRRASSAVRAKPYLVTGIPARSTILRLSNSKKRMRPRQAIAGQLRAR